MFTSFICVAVVNIKIATISRGVHVCVQFFQLPDDVVKTWLLEEIPQNCELFTQLLIWKVYSQVEEVHATWSCLVFRYLLYFQLLICSLFCILMLLNDDCFTFLKLMSRFSKSLNKSSSKTVNLTLWSQAIHE
jgi:hypothetical protein